MALVVVLSGCTAVGPDFKRPEAPVEKEWIETGDPRVKPQEEDYSTWWTVFKDPVLDKLVETARRQNLPLRIAGLRILEARAQLGIAVGNQYPQVQQARASYSRQETSINIPPASTLPGAIRQGIDRGFDLYDAGFNATWELDFWGRFRRGVESADGNLAASVAGYDNILVTLAGDVAATYLIIRTLDERLEVARQNVQVQERSLQISDVRFKNGVTTELDVQQARSLLFSTRASIPQLEIQLRQAKNALSILLGMPPSDLEDILGGPGMIPTPPPEVAVGIPGQLLRRRPDVRQAELQAAAQSALIGVAKADLYPSFVINGAFGWTADDAGNWFNGRSFEGFGAFGFQWNLFNYGRIKNNVRVQDARLQQAIVNYQNTVLSAAQEVEDGLVGFLRGQERTQLLAQSVQASQRSVELAILQYRDGTADYTRVLNTQQDLLIQQDSLVDQRGSVAGSLVAVYRALGGGWELRLPKDFVPEPTVREMRQRTNWGKLLPPTPEEVPETLDPPKPAREQPAFPRPDW